MGKLKKAVTLLISTLMISSMVGCTGGTQKPAEDKKQDTAQTTEKPAAEEKTSDEVITLNMWHIWAAESESSKVPFETAVKEFNEENPNIQVVLDATENEAYKTKMTATIAANEAPDIYFYWGGGYMKNIVDAGKVLALDDYLDQATKDKIINGTLTNMIFDGKTYGIGHSMSVGTFFVNTELFDKYGVKIPETWEELITACKTFKENDVTPIALGAKDTWCINMYLDIIETRAAGYDAAYNALTKKGSFVDDGIIEGAAKLQELIDLGAFTNGALGVTRDESEVPFYNGEVPMYLNGSWTIGNVNKSDAIKGKIKVVKFPTINEKSNINDFTGGVAETFIVNAATEHPEEAVYALTQISQKFSKNLYLSGAGIPTWKLDDVDESKIDALTLELVDLIQDANSFTLWWNTLLEGEDSEHYMNRTAELFAKQLTPEEFAAQLQTMNE